MRILWIVNTIFPEPSKVLGISVPVVGGWMYGLANQLAGNKEVALAVATVYKGDEKKCLDLNGVLYYLLPFNGSSGYNKGLESLWKELVSGFNPDIVHIHGTEYQHGLACMRACVGLKYVVSIQGLVSIYSRYYYSGLSLLDIIRNITLRDVLSGDSIIAGKKKFVKRGVYEEEYLVKSRHVIGRTDWDYAHINAVNSGVTYHHCDEILREGFYLSKKWDINSVNKYSVFLSQGNYPIKGLHQVIKAIAVLVDEYPEIRVRVAGHNILSSSTLVGRLKISGYASYLKRLIKCLGLKNNIEFVGLLSENEMIKEYLNAHLFICPSSIENSPNSVGEAQILGVPTIASYVGGIPDMIRHAETGFLYRFEEVEMLSGYIKKIFTNVKLARKLSINSIESAEKRHDKKMNCEKTMIIYKKLLV